MASCCLFIIMALYFVSLTTAGIMGDECDWTGSGLTQGTSRGVTPVYLRCRAGKIIWLYPRAALRVVMRLHNSNKDFRVCIKILQENQQTDQQSDLYTAYDEVLDFREGKTKKMNASMKEEQFPARLFLEGSRGLMPLYSSDDGGIRKVRCFRSKAGQAAIYVEARDGARAAQFQYDLQPLPAKAYDPATEECRPCSPQEMANAFCISDLVTRGVIVGIRERAELGTSELAIRITKLIRHISPDGHTYQEDTGAPLNSSADYQKIKELFTGRDFMSDNQIAGPPGKTEHLQEGQSTEWFARVQAGEHCGVAAGAGEFLIVATRRLGVLALTCAPRAKQWQQLANTLNENGDAHCLLTA